MTRKDRWWRFLLLVGGGLMLFLVVPACILHLCQESKASPPGGDGHEGWGFYGREHLEGPQALAGTWYNLPGAGPANGCGLKGCPGLGLRNKRNHLTARGCEGCNTDSGAAPCQDVGSWFWMRSPEQERAATASLFNRYCIRCHGVDGRGVWDIPGVPDFTNFRWQMSRSDDQIARIVIEGRGAVMPPFRGTLTLEEAWAMARYLRTFLPGTEASRPDMGPGEKASQPPQLRPPVKEE